MSLFLSGSDNGKQPAVATSSFALLYIFEPVTYIVLYPSIFFIVDSEYLLFSFNVMLPILFPFLSPKYERSGTGVKSGS